MNLSKRELEKHIKQKNNWKIYFDNYEISLENTEKEFYKGNEIEAKKKAIDSLNSQLKTLINFPIHYTKVSCEFIEND